MNVRAFEDRDQTQVIALWSLVFPDDAPRNAPSVIIDRKRGTQPELFLVGEHEERIVATAIGGYDGMRGWLYHLAVEPSQRRKQVGRTIVTALEDELGRKGCPKLNLQILDSNRAVVDFYRSLGFEVEERISMGKVLSPP